MPNGMNSGTPLIQYGQHGQASGNGTAMVVECGQHFLRSTSDLAIKVTLDFLAHFGLTQKRSNLTTPQRRFELISTHVIANDDFAFSRPVVGFETFAHGELIATDGSQELRSPCDDCTIFMPARSVKVGHEGFYLTRSLNS
jgi:succinylglutamate desuccinylase